MGTNAHKSKGASARRVSKTTKRPDAVTAAERDEAARTLLEGGQLDAVRAGYFCEAEHNLPIAGTPRPRPCPFCLRIDVQIVLTEHQDSTGKYYDVAHVDCTSCGAQAPSVSSNEEGFESTYALLLEAAKRWNTRGGES